MALTGFLVDHQCYPTAAGAVLGYSSMFPVYSGTTIVNLTAATLVAAPLPPAVGTASINATLSTDRLDRVQVPVVTTKSVPVMACDPAILIPANLTPFDPVAAAAFWMWGMTMVLGVYLVANNAGSILRFIQGKDS